MTVWDDAQALLVGYHRYGDGLSWNITAMGVSHGEQPGPEKVALATEVFNQLDVRSPAIMASVPVELLVATVCTETAGEFGVGEAAYNFRVVLPGYTDDGATPNLVRAGCCGIFLSMAREALGDSSVLSTDLYDPVIALRAAALHIASAANQTHLQPPMVAAVYNGILRYDQASQWRMASYDGNASRIDSFVGWFNAAFMVTASDASFAGDAPNFCLAIQQRALEPSPPAPTIGGSKLTKPDAQAALEAGMMVISSSSPTLSAIWSLDDTTTSQLKAVSDMWSLYHRLPGNAPAFRYPDRGGNQRVLSGDEVVALYLAISDYVAALWYYDSGVTPSLPGHPVAL